MTQENDSLKIIVVQKRPRLFCAYGDKWRGSADTMIIVRELNQSLRELGIPGYACNVKPVRFGQVRIGFQGIHHAAAFKMRWL